MTSAYAYGTRVPLDSGKTIDLTGRAGTQLKLTPGAEDGQMYTWTPEVLLPAPLDPRDVNAKRFEKLPHDYDVQVSWLTSDRPINNPPWVFWRLEYGHGENTYRLPYNTTVAPGTPDMFNPQRGWVLPNRGLRLRVPARAMKFIFYVPPEAEPPPEPAVPGGAPAEIQISVQPCHGLTAEQLPVTDMIYGGDPPAQLPLGSTELRFSNPNSGLEYNAGDAFLQFYDVTGAPVGAAVDSSLYAAWAPIPIFAAFWAPIAEGEAGAQVLQVSYR